MTLTLVEKEISAQYPAQTETKEYLGYEIRKNNTGYAIYDDGQYIRSFYFLADLKKWIDSAVYGNY